MMSRAEGSAWMQGAIARQSSSKWHKNPFNAESDIGKSWQRGFDSAPPLSEKEG